MADLQEGSAFSFSQPAGDGLLDELGVWQPRPPAAAAPGAPSGDGEEGSFAAIGAAAQTPPDMNYFLAELPAQTALANQALQAQRNRLQRSQWGLGEAQRRLESFSATGILIPEDAFSLPGLAPSSALRPELEMQRWMEAVAPQESFAALPRLPDDWKETAQAAGNFFQKVQQLITIGDIIESRLDGRRVGLTVVSLGGDFTTVWDARNRSASVGLHRQVLDQAIAIRVAWLNLASMVIGGAVQLTVLFSTNFILALPAAYKFFRQVLEQVQNWPTYNQN